MIVVGRAQRDWFGTIRRGLRKPPRVILQRLWQEISVEIERITSPRLPGKLSGERLAYLLGAKSFDVLLSSLRAKPHLIPQSDDWKTEFQVMCPDARSRVLAAADNAISHRVDLLGSGPVELGEAIDWHRDYKTNLGWPVRYFRDIDYMNRERPSDVKFPWELSRMQWLLPMGQAYLLTGNERYPNEARRILESWFDANPYAQGVNWACTMEVALRLITWTWLYSAFKTSRAWQDRGFLLALIRSLYLHALFTERHLERSDVNGNHYLADAAGLVFAGLFFGEAGHSGRWSQLGWSILSSELTQQVFPDGIDYEASVAYHRLVSELFLLPALYRERVGLDVSKVYRDRVSAMARFTACYSRSGGDVPLWGDADDGRVLPLGQQDVNDHRYLLGLVGAAWNDEELQQYFSGTVDEVFWILGADACRRLRDVSGKREPRSQSFPQGGVYIMRNERDHVFIDCGPVGLAGRGGHGHNDCLSFEAVLNNVKLITDCGAYVYTASYEERNNFRSTAYHNTPQVDGEEMNRFIQPDYLWNLHYDAVPTVHRWNPSDSVDIFCGSHRGYQHGGRAVTPTRTMMLDHRLHALLIYDRIDGDGAHTIEIPLHLASGVSAERLAEHEFRLTACSGETFTLLSETSHHWEVTIESARVSPQYGVALPIQRIAWHCRNVLPVSRKLILAPHNASQCDWMSWAKDSL